MATSVTQKQNQLWIEGELNFKTVPHLWKEVSLLFLTLPSISIDFSKVTRVDSAAMAFLIECKHFAKTHQKPVIFHHIPEQLERLAKLSGLVFWGIE